MNVFAFIAWIIAAVIFLFVGDTVVSTRFAGRSAVALGLFFFTLGAIIQLCSAHHTITF